MRRSFRRAAAAKLDCREQLHRQQLAVGWAAAVQAAAKVWGVAGSFFRSSPLLRREEQLAAECCSAAYPRLLADMRRVPTADNTSDVFTKTLGETDIIRLRPGLTGYGPLPNIPDAMPT